jgi:hypothetical protein
LALPHLPRDNNPARRIRRRAASALSGPSVVFVGFVLAAFIALAIAARALPYELLLPAVVALLFALAGLAALVGWRTRHDRLTPRLTYWDVAGALVFIGIGLSVLVEPDQMIWLVEDGLRGDVAERSLR